MRTIRRSAEAEKDIDEIVVYYSRQGLSLADRFIEEYEASLRAIEKIPGRGSPRLGNELGISGMRAYAMRHFPYLVFYREDNDTSVDIDRVLHSHRDILAMFLEQ